MRSLRRSLLNAELLRLRVIARFWDVTLTSNRRRDVASELAEAMTTLMAAPESSGEVWDTLSETERNVLLDLMIEGGELPMRVLVRRWGEIRAIGPGRMEREKPWRAPVSPVESLWYKGFIARAFDQGAEGAYEVGFIPLELRDHIPRSSEPTSHADLKAVGTPDVILSAGEALLDDACTLLAYLQNERVPSRPDDAWSTVHQQTLNRQLRHPDADRLIFLRHLVRRLGWLRVTDANMLRPEPESVTRWLQSSSQEQQRALVEGWRSDPTWNDLFHVPTLVPEDTGAWRNDPVLARKAVLGHLKICRPGICYAVDDFVAAIKRADFDFQRPDGDYETWYIRCAETGAYLAGIESWDDVEGALIRYLLDGPLAWLGLVDVGRGGETEALAVFRVSAAGAAFLDLEPSAPGPEEAAPIVIGEDFTVHVPPIRRYERFQLARVADWVTSPGKDSTSPQTAFVYRLTPTSLGRARRQGIPVARVLAFLDQATGEDTPLPRFVEAALTRWDARGREVCLERVTLLQVSDEEILDQVMASARASRLLDRRVGPAAALVKERNWSRLVVELGKMGLLPDVDVEKDDW